MFNNKRLKLSNFIMTLLQKCVALQAEIKKLPAYQIKDVNIVNGNYHIIVQINGTGKLVSYSIEEIALDDCFLKDFSTKDIRIILQLYFQDSKKPEYILVNQKFNKKGRVVFGLRKRSSGEILEVTADEISMNKELLKHCTPEDTHRIGFIYASEQFEKE